VKARPLLQQDTVGQLAQMVAVGLALPLVTGSKLWGILKRKDRHKGPGMSGFRFSHMVGAVASEGTKEEVKSAMAGVATLIMQGRVPKPLWLYVFGGWGGLADWRLFVAAESIVWLAEVVVLRHVMPKILEKKLLKYNLGVGTKGAADVLSHWTRRAMEDAKAEGLADIVML
jgi:hypothetical protein